LVRDNNPYPLRQIGVCERYNLQASPANRTRIGTTQPTRAGRSGGGASDAARSFGKLPVGDAARGSQPCRAIRVRKLEATRAKRATKRELIVVATMISR